MAVLVAVPWSLVVGCCWSPNYQGDGKIIAQGFAEPFRLDLGPISLTEAGLHTFRMQGLTGNLVVGLVTNDDSINANVHMLMVSDRSETVIDVIGPLTDWVWERGASSGEAFVYRAGESKDIPLSGHDVRVEPVGVRASGGWGSYFTPSARSRFVLHVDVLEPATAAVPAVHVVVKCVVGSL